MGRAPCCDKSKVRKGPWSPEEDTTLKNYLHKHGTTGNWIALPTKAGLNRCGKSCRLRWLNYLKPDIKRGSFTEEEDNVISTLYCSIGSRWSVIASQLPGRTDNDVKNYWNTKLKKKLLAAGKYYHVATRNTSDLNMAQLSASVPPKMETPDHIPETSSSCFGGSRGTLPHLANVSSGQSFDQVTQKFEPCNHQLSHSKPMEVSDFGTSERNSSLSQEVSSLPNSSSSAQLDQYHCSLWSGYEAGININYSEFLMGFGFETHPPPPGDHFLLDGFGSYPSNCAP